MQQAAFPLTLAIQLYYRANSDFFNKYLSVMQAVPCLVTQRQAALSSPQTPRETCLRFQEKANVLDDGFQSKHLD